MVLGSNFVIGVLGDPSSFDLATLNQIVKADPGKKSATIRVQEKVRTEVYKIVLPSRARRENKA